MPMRQSKLFTKTIKQAPKGEKSVNAILLQRAGFIYKEMAGVYSFLPLGLRVLRKVENIIRKEMENIQGQEILMSVLQPKTLWQKTGRWSKSIGKTVMYKCQQGEQEIGLGPTHEEMITDIISAYVKSYEDLPLAVFQIQTKFRKELRPKSGLLRGREFGMKDLYSFHANEKDFKNYYEKVKKAYLKIFQRCELEAILTEASGIGFVDGFTHEFQVLTENGEDKIIFCPKLDFSQNKDISKLKAGDNCPVCGNKLKQGKSIEVANIFPLGIKYSKAIGAFFQDKKGQKKPIIMGCYGLGVTRLMGALVEIFHDEKGIVWPVETAPFRNHFLVLGSKNNIHLKKTGEKIYFDLQKRGIEVLYDDRENKSAGEKLIDADLIGIPQRIVLSERTLQKNSIELKKRNSKQSRLVKIKEIIKYAQ